MYLKLRIGFLCLMLSCIWFSRTIGQSVEIDMSQIHSMHLKNLTSNVSVDTSLNQLYEHIAIIQSLKNKPEEVLAYKALGEDYVRQGNFVKAINCLLFSVSVAENLKDTFQIISLNNLLAYSLNFSYRFKEAKIYTDKVKKLLKEFPVDEGYAWMYLNEGHFLEKYNKPKEALKKYKKADEYNDIVKNEGLQASIYEGVGSAYEDLELYDVAGSYFKKALSIVVQQEQKDLFKIANISNNIGDFYRKTGQLDSAIILYNEKLLFCIKYDLKDEVSNNLKDLSKCYEEIGDYVSANECLKKLVSINNELYKSQISQQIDQLDIFYTLENNNKELDLHKSKIKSQNLTRTLLIMMLLFVGIVAVILLLDYRKQMKLNKRLAEKNNKIIEQSEALKKESDRVELVNSELIEGREKLRLNSLMLKETNEKYKQLNQEKDKLFDILAHDLKSPLQGIMGFTSILVEDYEELDESHREKYISLIDLSCKRIHVLVDNLLSWSRAKNDRLEPDYRCFDISVVIKDCIKLFELNAIQKQIKLQSQIDLGAIVYADKDMITLVLRNLISNAIKFSGKDSNVVINASKKHGNIFISVHDQGVGIKKEVVADLFNISNQHVSYGTAGEKGTGLGLLVCKEYIGKNNGTIQVESVEGKGSVFSFSLPTCKD